MELQIKEMQTNVVSEGQVNGRIIQFQYSHQEKQKPDYVGFNSIDLEQESSVSGAYYADSKQMSLTINNMQENDPEMIQSIYSKCIELTS